ncbi:MAG TPA: hypothetical protein VMV49_10195, partial [Candidatus Deferrimicrobium sp.]|nr:hypothetical protein [Candidatus Deferrimicrobium sp.]
GLEAYLVLSYIVIRRRFPNYAARTALDVRIAQRFAPARRLPLPPTPPLTGKSVFSVSAALKHAPMTRSGSGLQALVGF